MSQTPVRIPETMTPKEIGAYMGGLREHFKLSLQDVSERLHIRVRYVQAIEQSQIEQLPGKVYARGYVHTYAEFLGLDADQVAAQWFAALETTETPAPIPTTTLTRPHTLRHGLSRNWRGIGIAAVALVGVLVLFSQIFGSGDEKETVAEKPAVAPVPEDLLASVRNLVMPVPQNIRCLNGMLWLACFNTDAATQTVMNAQQFDSFLVGDIDPNDLPQPEESEADDKKSDDTAAVKKEDKSAKEDKADKEEKPVKATAKEDTKETKKEDKPADKAADKPVEKTDKKEEKPAAPKEEKKSDEKHD